MGLPYIGEIRMFAGNYAPSGWMFCEGQSLLIASYETLYMLIGTTYGGDGQSTFNLPDLRGRVPIHYGQAPGWGTVVLADSLGQESVTLMASQIPAHNHAVLATSAQADRRNPKGALFAKTSEPVYAVPGTVTAMAGGSTASEGGSQPHANMQPFLCVNFIIALDGIFPTPT